jgi:hypothetical protein
MIHRKQIYIVLTIIPHVSENTLILHMPLSPLPHSLRPWSVAILNAYQQLLHVYQTASSYMDNNSGSIEAHRLQQYGNTIISVAYPLLVLLDDSAKSELLPHSWIEDVSTEFTALLALIDDAWLSAKAEYVKNIMAVLLSDVNGI